MSKDAAATRETAAVSMKGAASVSASAAACKNQSMRCSVFVEEQTQTNAVSVLAALSVASGAHVGAVCRSTNPSSHWVDGRNSSKGTHPHTPQGHYSSHC